MQVISACRITGTRFDTVFLDPPYEYGLIEVAINSLLEQGVLNDGFRIVAEYAYKHPPATVPGLAVRSEKKYGDVGTTVYVEDVGI